MNISPTNHGLVEPAGDRLRPEPRAARPEASGQAPDNPTQAARQLARLAGANRPASRFTPAWAGKSAGSGRFLWRCLLPPVSAFSLQTNLRQYLESWPTPWATGSDEWPEYTREAEEDLD